MRKATKKQDMAQICAVKPHQIAQNDDKRNIGASRRDKGEAVENIGVAADHRSRNGGTKAGKQGAGKRPKALDKVSTDFERPNTLTDGAVSKFLDGQPTYNTENQVHRIDVERLDKCARISDSIKDDSLYLVEEGKRALSRTPVKLTNSFNAPSLPASHFATQKKLLVNCDWLSFRCVDTLIVDGFQDGVFIAEHYNTKYTLELLPGRASIYQNKCNVFINWSDQNIKIGLITFNSSLEIHKGTMVFKLENWVLYDEVFRVCVDDITQNLLHALKSNVVNVSRLDIAVDGVYLHDLMDGLVNEQSYQQFGKRTIDNKRVDPYSNALESFQVGKREGKKYAIYYNKSREIREKSKKDYITDYWKANGFDITNGDVWRFELTLHSEAIKEIEGIDIKKISSLLDPDFLKAAFELHIKRFYEFVHSSNDKNASRKEKVRVFDFSQSGHQRFEKVKKKVSDSHRTTKIMVKRLVVSASFEAKPSMRYHYLRTAARYVFENELSEWLTKRQLFIADDVAKAAKLNGLPVYLPVADGIVAILKDYMPSFQIGVVTPSFNVEKIDFS